MDEQYKGSITHKVIGKVYNKLKDNNSGKISYKNKNIYFELGNRDKENIPRQATVEVRNNSKVERYNLHFDR